MNQPAERPAPSDGRRNIADLDIGFFAGPVRLYAIDDSLRGVTCYKMTNVEAMSCVKTFESSVK